MAARGSTILIFLWPETSSINASFAFARRLKEADYQVVYFGLPKLESHVRRQGFDYVSVQDYPMPAAREGRPSLTRWWVKTRNEYLETFAWFDETVRCLDRWVAENRPVLALLDVELWRLSPPLLRANIPIVGINNLFASWINFRSPPVVSGIVPERGLIGKLKIVAAWSALWINVRARELSLCVKLFAFGVVHRQGAYGAGQQIARNGGRLRWGEYGYRLVGPELVMAPPDLDFPQALELPDRIYIGGCVDSARSDAQTELVEIANGGPLLYCSLGTWSHRYRDSMRLFQAVAAALERYPHWTAVIQAGDAAGREELRSLSNNILVARTVPQLDVLERAKVFITHGGASSFREGAYYGVPMIVFPCEGDQFGNAARIVYHGLGVRGDVSNVTPEQVLALMKAVQGETIQTGVARMKALIRREDHHPAALGFIDELALKSDPARSMI